MLEVQFASRASQGARNYQEDAAAVWPGPGQLVPKGQPPAGTALVAVLADGMGGHAAGDVASTTICGIFLQNFALAEGGNPEKLSACLTAANNAIQAHVDANPGLSGMGATCVGLVVGETGLDWISVGDSPLYLHRRGKLKRLNADHSLAPALDQLVADGKMDADKARNDPRRHYLRSAVTGEDLDLIDVSDMPLPLQAGDTIVLASDGLLTLEDDDIGRLIKAYTGDGATALAEALLRGVEAEGVPHQDNTTVIVLVVT